MRDIVLAFFFLLFFLIVFVWFWYLGNDRIIKLLGKVFFTYKFMLKFMLILLFQFTLKYTYFPIFKLTDSFFGFLSLLMSPRKVVLFLWCLISNTFFSHFLGFSISLLVLFICSYLISTFSIVTLNIFITIILNSLSANPKIHVIIRVWFDDCVVSSNLCFFLVFGMSFIVFVEWQIYQIIET